MTQSVARWIQWFWGPWSRLGLAVAAATFAVDQAHKWWMLSVYRIAERGRVEALPFLDLVFVKNLGISYGLFTQESAAGQFVLAGSAVLACIALAIWLARGAMNSILAISLGLIIGGALGNALDRILIGGVADFFELHAWGLRWYVFNIADAAIVAGVAGLLYDHFWVSRKGAANSS